jgi:hypothetical protein
MQRPCEPKFSAVERRTPGGSFGTSRKTVLLDKPRKCAAGTGSNIPKTDKRALSVLNNGGKGAMDSGMIGSASAMSLPGMKAGLVQCTIKQSSKLNPTEKSLSHSRSRENGCQPNSDILAERKPAWKFATVPFGVQQQSELGSSPSVRLASKGSGNVLDLSPDPLCLRPRQRTGAVCFGCAPTCALRNLRM